ncbi:MAG: DUF3102 domain-containing protein [Methanobacterium sp.]|nr:DUF3102 domain-containing protein [Methanobacterium sp.]
MSEPTQICVGCLTDHVYVPKDISVALPEEVSHVAAVGEDLAVLDVDDGDEIGGGVHDDPLLLSAKAAGEALIEAKKQLAHGQFKPWVEANTRVSYAQASKYMRVARQWEERKSVAHDTFADLSIEAFLGYAKPKPAQASNHPTFTEDDAEYALKIAARMGSDFEGEREVAKAKRTADLCGSSD